MIAIILKTFNKRLSLLNTLASIEKYCDLPYRLYILDDGWITEEVRAKYDMLRANGHFVEISDRHWPVTEARNYLASKLTDERYVLRIDDDFEFTERTSLQKMMQLLNMRADIGVVSETEIYIGASRGLKPGELSYGQGYLVRHKGSMIKVNIPVEKWSYYKHDGIRWAFCDHARNFLLMKREMLQTVRWDNEIFFEGEHLDFMMSISAAGWKLAFTPDSSHIHRDDLSDQDKKDFKHLYTRKRTEERTNSLRYLADKWNFTEVESYYPFVKRIYKVFLEFIGQKPSLRSVMEKHITKK